MCLRQPASDHSLEWQLQPSIAMDVFLPDHLVYEILLSVPAKSLLRFRTLSRHWCHTISSHGFAVDRHCRRHKSGKQSHYYVISYSYAAASITLYPDTGKPYKLDLPTPVTKCNKGEFSIHSSFCGLLCATLTTTSSRYVILWNPVTRECREFSDCAETFGYESAGMAETGAKFALGFDPATNDYKVVKMTSTRDMHRPNRKICILSLKTNYLKKVEDQTQYMPIHPAVSIDGYIFWLAKGPQYTYAVLKFNLACDHLSPIHIPPEATMKTSPHEQINLSLHECSGSVRLVRFEREDGIQWNMKHVWLLSNADGTWKDISSWYKAALCKSFRGWDGPLGFTPEAAVVIDRRVADCARSKEDGVERIWVDGSLKDAHRHVLHCESLVSPWQ